MLADNPPRMDDTGDPCEEAEEDVDQELTSAAYERQKVAKQTCLVGRSSAACVADLDLPVLIKTGTGGNKMAVGGTQ